MCWLEHIFIKKDTIAYNKAVEIENGLADYPLLDESDYYDKLYEQSQDFWEGLSTQEKIEICKEHGQSIFSARADRIPDNCGIEEYCQSDI